LAEGEGFGLGKIASVNNLQQFFSLDRLDPLKSPGAGTNQVQLSSSDSGWTRSQIHCVFDAHIQGGTMPIRSLMQLSVRERRLFGDMLRRVWALPVLAG